MQVDTTTLPRCEAGETAALALGGAGNRTGEDSVDESAAMVRALFLSGRPLFSALEANTLPEHVPPCFLRIQVANPQRRRAIPEGETG